MWKIKFVIGSITHGFRAITLLNSMCTISTSQIGRWDHILRAASQLEVVSHVPISANSEIFSITLRLTSNIHMQKAIRSQDLHSVWRGKKRAPLVEWRKSFMEQQELRDSPLDLRRSLVKSRGPSRGRTIIHMCRNILICRRQFLTELR